MITQRYTAERFYGNDDELLLYGYSIKAGEEVEGSEIAVRNDGAQITPEAIDQRLEEVAKSTRVIEINGQNFSISEVNRTASSEDTLLHMSTYSSAIPENPGNAYEFAAQGARYPHIRQVYVSSPGNGSTDPLPRNERKFAAQEGRFTHDTDGATRALPTFQNLAEGLEKEGLKITRLSGDSLGAAYATAVGAATKEGQIESAFFSERPGFRHMSKLAIIKGMLITEQMKNSKENRETGEAFDAECLTDEMIDRAKVILAEHANGEMPKNGLMDTLKSLTASMQASRRGPVGKIDPKAWDTNALLARQPDMQAVFTMAERDPLYGSPELAHETAKQFLGNLTLKGAGIAGIVMIPEMTHAYNTYFPQLYQRLKAQALFLDQAERA